MTEYALHYKYKTTHDWVSEREDCLQIFGLKELKATIKNIIEQGDTILDLEIRYKDGTQKTLDIDKYIRNSKPINLCDMMCK